MKKRLYWFWLYNLQGIGRTKMSVLLEVFSSVEAIWRASEKELSAVKGLTQRDIHTILNSKNEEVIIKQYQQLIDRNIKFVTIEDVYYPNKLKNIYDPPFCFYLKGALPDANTPSIAIVGSRKCSVYGREMARFFARELAKQGFQIISGLARGIDAQAHKGAIEGNGKTFGVLGNGINICYPKENLTLSLEMEKTGGVISEYHLNVQPRPGHFPLRNRIISGLCDGIFVIEAAKRSGSLITAELGLDQGKDIFALPGRLTDPLSEGTNHLIRMGAKMVVDVQDITEEYGFTIKTESESREGNFKKIEKLLDKSEKMVYACLGLEPKHIDDIAYELNVKTSELMHILLMLEMKGVIKQLANKHFIISV